MPHCVIEYSTSLETRADELVATVFQAVSTSPLFDAKTVRVRASAYEHYQLGEASAHFLHITIRLLQGRNDEQKTRLTQRVTEAVQALHLSDAMLSCECVEIHTASVQRITLS